jgi:HK97 family phage major capsid protein/HK97 family phage prohead protease
METMIRQFGQLRKSDNDDRTIEFIFSTSAKDRHRTVLNKDGWELDNFNNNGIAGYMHDVYGDGILAKPDPDDVIGKARAWVDGDNLIGEITFEPADLNEKADKIYRKIQFGSLNAVSVGFIEKGQGEMKGGDDPTYHFAGQELLEISVVNIPSNPEALKARSMKEWDNFYKSKTSDLTTEVVNNNLNNNTMAEEKVDGLTNEMTHKVEVEMKTDKFDEAVGKLTESVERIEKSIEDMNIPGPAGSNFSEQDEKDYRKFSYRKMIMEAAAGKLTGLEKEMNEEGKKELKDAGCTSDELAIAVPTMIHSRATLQATVDAAGGYAVPEDTLGLIPTLRNKFAVGRAGATILSNLQGDIKFPRRASDSVAYWRSEGGLATQSDSTYEALTLSPNRLTAYSMFSRQFLRQSSFDVEAEVRDTLMYAHLNALETAVYTGSGTSNQPTGLFASSINDGDHGSNGTVLNWDNIVQLERMVADDNALDGSLAYITSSKAAGTMKVTLKSTYQGGYIWSMDQALADGSLNGYDAYVSNNVPTNLTRGTGSNLTAVIFGNWKDLIIGQWGAMEFIVNPYSRDQYDEIRITGVGYFDLGLRHVESFAAIEGLEV